MRRRAEASTYIKAPPALVYSLLTDYGRYRDWMPDVTASRLLARETGVAVAELVVPPYGHRKVLLELVESPRSWLTFHEIDRLREFGISGRWDLEPVDAGQGVVARARLELRGGLRQLGAGSRLRAVLHRTLDALALRALQAAAADKEGAARRKVFEIERRANRFEIHLGDRTYVAEGATKRTGE